MFAVYNDLDLFLFDWVLLKWDLVLRQLENVEFSNVFSNYSPTIKLLVQ